MGRIHLMIHAALIGVIITLVVYIKGLWFVDGLETELRKCRDTVSALDAESAKAKAVSTAIARSEENRHAENLAVTLPAARRYVERHRLQHYPGPATASPVVSTEPRQSTPVPELDQGSDPAPVSVPEPGWVAVRATDVEVCTTNFEQAWTGYSFIKQLQEAGYVTPALEPQPKQ